MVLCFAASLARLDAATPTAGSASGYALTYDGRGSDTATAHLPAELFQGASGFTITMWIRVFGFIAPPFFLNVFSILTPMSSSWFGLAWMYSGGTVYSEMFDSSAQLDADAAVPGLHISNFRSWRHLAITWSSAGDLSFYVDGELQASLTGQKVGYNVTKGAERGAYISLGGAAYSDKEMLSNRVLRGSLDHFQLWTRALDADEIRADYRTLGASVPQPLLRYTFDEGAGELAMNTGTATGTDLRLGQIANGLHFFTDTNSQTSHRCTSPVFAPSQLPLVSNNSGLAPIVQTYRAGASANVSLDASTQRVRLASLPAGGRLQLNGADLAVGVEVPSGAIVTFAADRDVANATSFIYEAAGTGGSANGTVHLLPEAPPTVVYNLAPCTWPLGVVQCAPPQLTVATKEDEPVTIVLIGRSPHGTDRTTAVVVRVPTSGTLYQLSTCCDASVASARGAIIRDGDEVLDGGSAVVFVPALHAFGDPLNEFVLTSLSFYVRDSSGAASANATMTITVTPEEDAPELTDPSDVSPTSNSTSPLTPVFVPLRTFDAEGDTVTLTLAQLPAHGKLFLPDAGAPGAELLECSGVVDPSQMLRQHAVDVVGVSSFWPGSASWHPLQALGPQGACGRRTMLERRRPLGPNH